MQVDRICWPVARSSPHGTRPEQLVKNLRGAAIAADATFEHHGHRGKEGRRTWPSLLFNRGVASSRTCAILSPLFIPAEVANAVWIDLYDDWSIAPDIRAPLRAWAAVGYRRLRAFDVHSTLLTTNSVYMRDKVYPARAVVVPNGVDPALADVELPSYADCSLYMVGNFFRGRTDWRLMEQLALTDAVTRVHIFDAPTAVQSRISRWSRPGRVVFHERMPMEEVARTVGDRAILAVPHVVSDYTLSQDLMKAYQAVALGHCVVAPRELLPPAIPLEYVYAIERGVSVDQLLRVLRQRQPSTRQERRAFAKAHSWESRASLIHGHLHEL